MKILAPFTASLFALTLASATWAEDTGLYAEPAPDDAAFVRFIGFADRADVQFAGHSFDVPEEQAAYVAVSATRLNGVAAGQYISVVNHPDGHRVISEPARGTRTKVHLFVVNASPEPVSLKLGDGSMTVIDTVAPGTAESRAVNPVSAQLALFAEGQTEALAHFDVALRRGQNLSFVAQTGRTDLIAHRFGPVVR